MIFFTNNDQPGVIGNIGTVLGKGKVNIAGMHLGREQQGGKALALLLVDNPVANEVMEQFGKSRMYCPQKLYMCELATRRHKSLKKFCGFCAFLWLILSLLAATPLLVGKTTPGAAVRVIGEDGRTTEAIADKRSSSGSGCPGRFHLEIRHDGYRTVRSSPFPCPAIPTMSIRWMISGGCVPATQDDIETVELRLEEVSDPEARGEPRRAKVCRNRIVFSACAAA